MSSRNKQDDAFVIVKHGDVDYYGLPELKNKDAEVSTLKKDNKLVVSHQGETSYFLKDFYKQKK